MEAESQGIGAEVAAGKLDALLCYMPFGPLVPPSLALGLLQAGAERIGAHVESRYFSMSMAKTIGLEAYRDISARLLRFGVHEVGQWIFSGALFESDDSAQAKYVDEILRKTSMPYRPLAFPEDLIEEVLRVRGQVEGFLRESVEVALARAPSLIGFSCTYYQRVPSLALANRIKERSPETVVVFGGADCEGIMGAEIIRRFPFLDAVVSGSGDVVFPEIVKRVLEGRSLEGMQGVYTHHEEDAPHPGTDFASAPIEPQIDQLPFPNYDDYFRQLEEVGLELEDRPWVSLETARGCWWAEKKKRCIFCAENLRDVAFRSKSTERVVAELAHIEKRYRPPFVNMIDRALDTTYFERVIPSLAARSSTAAEMLFSARATLSKEQMGALREAGVTSLGVGIESLSTPVLKLMRKGATALQNIQILKWSQEHGPHVLWNMLWGFPGEEAGEYERMARLIPRLTHLPPPKIETQVVLMRYSPLFDEADAFGLTDVSPAPVYSHIYPFEPSVVSNLAYYFEYCYRMPRNVDEYTRDVKAALQNWRRVHDRSELLMLDEGHRILVLDRRPSAPQRTAVLTGLDRIVLLACDPHQKVRKIQSEAAEALGVGVSEEAIKESLQWLDARWLVIRDGNRWLSLTIPASTEVDRERVKKSFDARRVSISTRAR